MLVAILLTWFPNAQGSRFAQFLEGLVDPYLNWFRRFIPPIMGFDLSPVPAYLLLYLLQRAIDIIFMNLLY